MNLWFVVKINILHSESASHCSVEEHLSGEPQSSLIGRSEEGPWTDSSSLAFGAVANSGKTSSKALTSRICHFGLADLNTHLEKQGVFWVEERHDVVVPQSASLKLLLMDLLSEQTSSHHAAPR